MESIIKVEHLAKKYKGFAIDDISFEVEAGRITGLIGVNGAGKTTIIKSIAGLVACDFGRISFPGGKSRENIGYVLDSSYFYENLKLKEMTEVVSAAYKKWDAAVYKYYCNNFRLEQNKTIGELSKGMKMKYALALALSHNADILVMDEPTGGLDPLVRNTIMGVLKAFVADGKKSVLFSTHITSDLEKIADNIIFLHNGCVVYQGKLKIYMEKYRVVQGNIEQMKSIEPLLLTKEVEGYSFKGLAQADNLLGNVRDLKVSRPSLEDVMLGVIDSQNGGV